MSDLTVLKGAREWASSYEVHYGLRAGACDCCYPAACRLQRLRESAFDRRPLALRASGLETLVKTLREAVTEQRALLNRGARGTKSPAAYLQAVAFLERRCRIAERAASRARKAADAEELAMSAKEAEEAAARSEALRAKWPAR